MDAHTPCQKQTFLINYCVYHDQLLANYTGPQVAKANRGGQ